MTAVSHTAWGGGQTRSLNATVERQERSITAPVPASARATA